MSMTREEAIKWLEETIQDTDTYWESCSEALQKELDEQKEVFLLVLSALRPVSREQLSEFKTCELVGELRKREGVETHTAEPYQDVTVSVNGPAVVLVVID